MLKRLMLVIVILMIPITGHAREESFTRDGTRVTIRVTPDDLVPKEEVTLAVRLEKEGATIVDRTVSLEVFQADAKEPFLKENVEVLDDEYLESWTFENPGDYRVRVDIADPAQPKELLSYEIKATVNEPRKGGHGFFEHHFGGSWGWWMGGMMILMIPMMILM